MPLPSQIGCAEIPQRVSRSRYFDYLPYLEQATSPQVKLATLRKQRRAMPREAAIGIVVDPAGAGPSTVDRDPWLASVTAIAQAVEASTLVLRPPDDYAPTEPHRDDIRALLRAIGQSPDALPPAVFAPRGLWTAPLAISMALEAGAVPAWDPLALDPTAPVDLAAVAAACSRVYLRIEGPADRRALREDDLFELEDLAGLFDASWVVFATPARFDDATRFAELLYKPHLSP